MTSPPEVHASRFLRSLERLERARPVARVEVRPQVLDAARTLVQRPGGLEKLAELAPRFDAAGVFAGTDWDDPSVLVPQLVERTLACREPHTVVLECLSELRLLSIARGRVKLGISAPRHVSVVRSELRERDLAEAQAHAQAGAGERDALCAYCI